MTINLEKELIKANKKLLTPDELLIIKEYEQHAGLVDNDALKRVGLDQNIKGGRLLSQQVEKLKQETMRFKQERVFHISQIEKTCNDYYLRFLPSALYQGTIDKDLPFKISNFEAAYRVKCQCDESEYKTQNTFIMAPAASFKLEEKPKDPLFFYQINKEYYYLIHKWGNDLSITRRAFSIASKPWFFYFVMILVASVNFYQVEKGVNTTIQALNLTVGSVVFLATIISTAVFGVEEQRWASFIKPNKFNSKHL